MMRCHYVITLQKIVALSLLADATDEGSCRFGGPPLQETESSLQPIVSEEQGSSG